MQQTFLPDIQNTHHQSQQMQHTFLPDIQNTRHQSHYFVFHDFHYPSDFQILKQLK